MDVSKVVYFMKNTGRLTGGTYSADLLVQSLYPRTATLCIKNVNSPLSNVYCLYRQPIQWLRAALRAETFLCADHYAVFPILAQKNTIFYYQGYFGSSEATVPIRESLLESCYRWIIRNAAIIVASSEFTAKYVRALGRRCVTVYPPFDKLVMATPVSKVVKLRKAVMVGNIEQRKYGNLLRILDKVPFTIGIYGRIADVALAAVLQASPKVTLHGYYAGRVPFDSYDFLLHVSRSENVPAVIPEAIMSGIPVVAVGTGGVSELVDSTTGIICSIDRVADSVEAHSTTGFCFDNRKYRFIARSFDQDVKDSLGAVVDGKVGLGLE